MLPLYKTRPGVFDIQPAQQPRARLAAGAPVEAIRLAENAQYWPEILLAGSRSRPARSGRS